MTYFIPYNNYVDACTSYKIAVVKSTGEIETIGCESNYNTAKTQMLAHNSDDHNVAVIYSNNKIINAKYAITKMKTVNTLISLFPTPTATRTYTSTHSRYGTDAAFIDYDIASKRVKIKISGYTAWVNDVNVDIIPVSTLNANTIQITASTINVREMPSVNSTKLGEVKQGSIHAFYGKTVQGGYTWYKIIFNGQTAYVADIGTWLIESDGILMQTYYSRTGNYLKFTFEYKSSTGAPLIGGSTFSKAPSFIEANKRYYSFDSIYYYDNLIKLLDDYRANTSTRAINQNPYYPYYLFLPNRSKTGYTAQDFDQYMVSKLFTREPDPLVQYITYNPDTKALTWVSGIDRSGMSLMVNQGANFVEAANTYGINALMMFGTAYNESGGGTSRIAFYKNNLFGLGASDDNPVDGARPYDTPRDSIIDYAKFTGSSNSAYSDPTRDYYFGSHYGNKGSGMNVFYATDPYWGKKQASHSLGNDISFGLQDYDANTIGVTNKTSVKLYKQPDTNSPIIYTYRNPNHLVENIPVIVFDKVSIITDGVQTNFYKVYSDVALDENQSISSGNYTFETSFGYIKEEDLYVVNNQPTINVDDLIIARGAVINLASLAIVSDTEDGNIPVKNEHIITNLNTDELGEYFATYSVEDKSKFQINKTIKITVVPAETPIIVAKNKSIPQNTTIDLLDGIKAYDKNEIDISHLVTVKETNLDTTKIGIYNVTYFVEDSYGKTFERSITIEVLANKAPVIKANDLILELNSIFDPLNNVSASDNEDGNLTANIAIIKNEVNTAETGSYEVTYQVSDSKGVVVTKTIIVTIEDKVYQNRLGDFFFNELNFTNNKLIISGSLAITGINNTSSTEISYSIIFKDNETGREHIIPLERWLINHPTRAYPNAKFDYTKSWFKGEVDLTNVPQGEYTLFVRARSGTLESKNLFRNILGKAMVRKATDSSGRGYLFRNNNYKMTYPIEVFIRDSGLIANGVPSTMANKITAYSNVSINQGIMSIDGYAFNLNTNLSNTTNVNRQLVFENTETFERITYNLTTKIGTNIPVRVDDGKSRTKAWFESTNINLASIPNGTYAIYVRTTTNELDDYAELNDIFMRNVDMNTMNIVNSYSNNKNFVIRLNKNARFRLELIVKN
jgi:beta-N-acetylglucosaminidase